MRRKVKTHSISFAALQIKEFYRQVKDISSTVPFNARCMMRKDVYSINGTRLEHQCKLCVSNDLNEEEQIVGSSTCLD